MIGFERERVQEIINILKRLDVRGFESNDLLIALVRYLNNKLAECQAQEDPK